MSKVIIEDAHLMRLSDLDQAIRGLNNKKIRILFELLGIRLSDLDFNAMLEWSLILISVPDLQMAVQLNRLSSFIPNLKFIVAPEQDLFTIGQGRGERRVWKE